MSYLYSLNDRAYDVHEWAKKQGFWDNAKISSPNRDFDSFAPPRLIDNPSLIPEKLALVHTEVSEAMEAWRDDDQPHLAEELADVILRVLDLAQFLEINIEQEVINKHQKNLQRPHKNGRKR